MTVTRYHITATVLYPADKDGYRTTKQVPMFILDANTLGLMNVDHAQRVAADMLTDLAGAHTLAHCVVVPFLEEVSK